jgi:arabinose-5-phosphate isomerase
MEINVFSKNKGQFVILKPKILPAMSYHDPENTPLQHARSVIEIEAAAVTALIENLDENFDRACQMILDCRGRVVVIGMGKSGHIGAKIASTLASTGTPAFFLHPGEASHGDIGMITTDDLVITISNSGETMEVITIIPIVKRLGVSMIAMTGKKSSTLAQQSDACLDVSVAKEACPHNLAPTASTTATLVMGDALAVTVQRMRGFSAQDFARTHPGGVLGRRLLLFAKDLMHSGEELPLAGPDESMGAVLLEMSSKSLGMVGIVDDGNRLLGMFTDGDLRRALENEVDIYTSRAGDLMTRDPFTISEDTLAEEIVKTMRDFAQQGPHAINGLFVVDGDSVVVGALNTHDLLRAGVI